MTLLSARSLIGAPVGAGGERGGMVDDVLLEDGLQRTLGFVVETRLERRCFVPWATAAVVHGTVVVPRAALERPAGELDGWLATGIRMTRLTDLVVTDENGGDAVVVSDVRIDEPGRVHDVVLLRPGGVSDVVPLASVRDALRVRGTGAWEAPRPRAVRAATP